MPQCPHCWRCSWEDINAPSNLDFDKLFDSLSLLASAWLYIAGSPVTLLNNFVTVFHVVAVDPNLPVPWPNPLYPPQADDPILIWGGSSSVGQYALQILKYYGHRTLIATASKQHHKFLDSLGAAHVVDYRDPDVKYRP